MLKIYLKQALETVRQERLFSSIYVVGTGLSVALAMTLFIICYVKVAPIYPEYNRNRMVVIKYVCSHPAGNPENFSAGMVSPEVAGLLDGLPHLQDMAMTCSGVFDSDVHLVTRAGLKQAFGVYPLFVSPGFWRVFTFRFLDGGPFTGADNDARTHTAVISESLARKLFASVDAAGKTFLYQGNPYTVSGVVRDVSSATPNAVADVWLPLSLSESANTPSNPLQLRGSLTYYLTAPTSADTGKLKEEVRDAFRRYDLGQEWVNDLLEQPDDAALAPFRTQPSQRPDIDGLFRSLLYIVLALLFIPAVNLGGMIASRMERRISELGIRKAYGATSATLLGQVMWENLLLTLAGGVLGLVFCYIIVLTSGSWILTLFDGAVDTSLPVPFLTMEMLFNPWVFFCALGLCLFINVLSALVPAWWALRRTIVEELYAKR